MKTKTFFEIRSIAAVILLLSFATATAQRQLIHTNGIWLCHWGFVHLNDRLTIVTEAELHLKQWVERWNEQVLDAGLLYRPSAKWRTGAGFGIYRSGQYFNEFFFKNEWRGWQEADYFTGKQWLFRQRLRVEERWIQGLKDGRSLSSYDYVTRMRYRTELQKPLRNGRLTPTVGNEFMVSPGYWNSDRFLDQNRTWVGVNFKLSRTISLQTQYMKIFQWRANNTLEDQNIFRLNVVQQFNLKE